MESVLQDIPSESKQAAKEYISEKEVSQLFESITAGLLHHRPQNPVEFVQECLENVRDTPELIRWNTFVEYTPSERCRSAKKGGGPTQTSSSPFTPDHKLPKVDPSKREIEASLNQGYKQYTEAPEGTRDYTDEPEPERAKVTRKPDE